MLMRFLMLALLPSMAILPGCSDPETKLIGSAASPDGKQEFTLYVVMRGAMASEYLALNVAAPNAPYSPDKSVASFHKATDLRAFWTADGRPVLIVRSMNGGIFDDISEMMVCVGPGTGCSGVRAQGRQIAVKNYGHQGTQLN